MLLMAKKRAKVRILPKRRVSMTPPVTRRVLKRRLSKKSLQPSDEIVVGGVTGPTRWHLTHSRKQLSRPRIKGRPKK